MNLENFYSKIKLEKIAEVVAKFADSSLLKSIDITQLSKKNKNKKKCFKKRSRKRFN